MIALLALFLIETRFIEYRHPCPVLDSGDQQGALLIRAIPGIAQDARVRRLMNLGTGLGPLAGPSWDCMILP